MSTPLQGKAIIEKCRQRVEAATGKQATYALIIEAIAAKTQVNIPKHYLFNLSYHDRRPSEKYRAAFAQFLDIDIAQIALHCPNETASQRATRRHAATHRQSELDQLIRWFIVRPPRINNHRGE